MNNWKLVWREIGWQNFSDNTSTVHDGWAIEMVIDADYTLFAWVENDRLAIYDSSNYPSGCYDIPFDMIDLLKEKSK